MGQLDSLLYFVGDRQRRFSTSGGVSTITGADTDTSLGRGITLRHVIFRCSLTLAGTGGVDATPP